MKKLILSILALGLPFTASATDFSNNWVKVIDGKQIEDFMQKDQVWTDAIYAVAGGSGSGGTTGLHLMSIGGGGGGTILPGTYKIDSIEIHDLMSEMGITPKTLQVNEFYNLKNLDGLTQMGFFSVSEWVVSK